MSSLRAPGAQAPQRATPTAPCCADKASAPKPSASSPPRAAGSACCAPAKALAPAAAKAEAPRGCCATKAPAPGADADARAAAAPPPASFTAQAALKLPDAGAMSTHLAELGPARQYRHAFVEGCTCGSGVMGCCPCTVGLAEHGALRAGHPAPSASGAHGGHGPAMAAAGALGMVGLALGLRAMRTNLEADGRVQRAQAHNAERVLTLLGRRQATDAVAPTPVVRRQLLAAQERAAGLHHSRAERRFNFWVPGAVQLMGSAFMVLACVQHFGLHALAGLPFAGLATGVLAGYAGLYAARALWRAADAFAAFAAVRRQVGDAERDAFAEALHAASARTLVHRIADAASWSALALGSGAVVALPALGAAVGAGLAAWVAAAQVAAVATSLAWPAPVHTVAGPRLDEAFASGALADAKLREAWLQSAAEQAEVVGRISRALLIGEGTAAAQRRLRHKLEPWTTPQCGPDAYRAVAGAFVAQLREGGAWPAAVDAAIADYLDHEMVWLEALVAALRADAAALAPVRPEGQAQGLALRQTQRELEVASAGSEAITPMGATVRIGGAAARLATATRLRDHWRALAARSERGGSAERGALMVETAASVGLLGEVAGGLVVRRPEWFYAAPNPRGLAFAHVVLRPERAGAFAEAMGPNLAFAFVRCLFNPNRLVAETEAALTAGAWLARQPGGLAQQTTEVEAGEPAKAPSFGPSCSRCVA